MSKIETSFLIEQVRDAKERSRELDAKIEVALAAFDAWHDVLKLSNTTGKVVGQHKSSGRWITYLSPRYTTSLDVAIELCKRVLPRWQINVKDCGEDVSGWAYLKDPHLCPWFRGATPSLALVLTVLTVVQQEKKDA